MSVIVLALALQNRLKIPYFFNACQSLFVSF